MTAINDNHYLKDSGYTNYESTTGLARHRWYYYKEGFSPLLVDKAIEEVGMSNRDILLDPFNGSGTSTLAASIKGLHSFGIEVNPFTAFLSQAKVKSINIDEAEKVSAKIQRAIEKGYDSDLIGFSTFSRKKGLDKWLFNTSVLKGFEGGWKETEGISSYNLKKIMKLALIIAAMDNCNATRDGKCLRYRQTWQENKYNKQSFLHSFNLITDIIKADVKAQPILGKSTIIQGDAREVLKHTGENLPKFKLCITSPPYLNTFDYTDIYRPELFLGKFVANPQQLYDLRLRTVRSHVQASWDQPTLSDFGLLYQQTQKHLIDNFENLMHKRIPTMVQAYFEDMYKILRLLKSKAAKDGQLWLVVSNSAYANLEIPVDLIIGDIGAKAGWFLKEIAVLRYIQRRKTRYSKDISELRESVVIFQANK